MGTPTSENEEFDRVAPPLSRNEQQQGTTVRLPIGLWKELREALAFEKEIRKAAKIEGAFKLNDLLRFFSKWALKQYWREMGGRPSPTATAAERKARVQSALEKRLKDAADQAAKHGRSGVGQQ